MRTLDECFQSMLSKKYDIDFSNIKKTKSITEALNDLNDLDEAMQDNENEAGEGRVIIPNRDQKGMINSINFDNKSNIKPAKIFESEDVDLDYSEDAQIEEENNEDEPDICSICGEPIEGYGNNAQPVNDGRCCDRCNWEYVIPARIAKMKARTDESLKESDKNISAEEFANRWGLEQ